MVQKNKIKKGLWYIMPESFREMIEAPYRREAKIAVEKILKTLGSKKIDVLDIGAGDCFAEAFFKNTPHFYKAIDIKPGEGVENGDVQSLNFSENSFDFILCLEVLEYVAYPEKALREIFRVLRRGGNAVITTPLLVTGYHDDLHRWSLPKLQSLIREAGFEEKTYPMGGYYRMLGWQISKISYKVKKPKNPVFLPLYYLIKIPVGLVFQILIPLILFSLDFLDREKRDTCGYVVVAKK